MRAILSIGFVGLALLSIAIGIEAALHITGSPGLRPATVHSGVTPAKLQPLQLKQQVSYPPLPSVRRGQVLVLPNLSPEFAGYWGGLVRASIQRLTPDLSGTSPARVSAFFLRNGDTTLMTSAIYTSASERIIQGPVAKVLSPRLVIVQYQSKDNELRYVCSHRFWLVNSSSVRYQAIIRVYAIPRPELLGIITNTANMKRLITAREQLQFATPSASLIPRAVVSTADRSVDDH